jgi:hypothetical protein
MTTRSFCKRLVLTCLAGAGLLGSISGCDGSSGLEKPEPGSEGPPDMGKMPGYNEMQNKLKGKKGATTLRK